MCARRKTVHLCTLLFPEGQYDICRAVLGISAPLPQPMHAGSLASSADQKSGKKYMRGLVRYTGWKYGCMFSVLAVEPPLCVASMRNFISCLLHVKKLCKKSNRSKEEAENCETICPATLSFKGTVSPEMCARMSTDV